MSWLSELFGGENNSAAIAADSARQMREAEAKRQADIRAGQGKIDEAFSLFNPEYYQKFRDAYTGNYLPQIGEQYDVAKDKLVATLAGRGTLESTPGAAKFGQLQRTRSDAEAKVGGDAVDAENQLRSRVENSKSNLYNLNTAAADPQSIGAQAIGSATTIAAPPSLTPLGQVFASTLQGLGTYNKTDATSMSPSLPWNKNSGFYAPITGTGSSLFGK